MVIRNMGFSANMKVNILNKYRYAESEVPRNSLLRIAETLNKLLQK